MDTIKQQIERFERLQQELTIMAHIGIVDRDASQRIYDELKQLTEPKLKLILGGKK